MPFTPNREFTYARTYRGPVRCVIFDWAGTTLDFGCLAPAIVFCEVFENAGVAITMEEARRPMGVHKKVHIDMLCAMPSVRQRWAQTHGAEPDAEDAARLFADFVPRQEACLPAHCALIPGALESIAQCRQRGYRIGASSGYLPGMLAIVRAEAAKQGYVPEAAFGAGDVKRGRPYPDMVLRNMLALAVSPVQSVVKIDDTLSGLEEGLNAGAWAIGVAISGNEVGVSQADWQAMPAVVQQRHRERVYPAMYRGGAHYVIDSMADLMPCLDDIECRLARGEKP